ncbi:MAG: PfkB family carbohydrate kinase [Treponema sp.]|jgi:sugar/nucleoside kinase (ribokinase family)|nr:PfkB family carbohydrate kinase [Treponema sp.]
MKHTLVIGSTVADVLIRIPHIPKTGEDITIEHIERRLGGCAYNVARMLRVFNVPHRLCSPVGTGLYGRFVRECFEKEGITPFISLAEENGCCFCLIEENGERSFLSHQGAEYMFDKQWIKTADCSGIDSIFICGIDVEYRTGNEIVEFVEEHSDAAVYFAPGPRIMSIDKDRMERLLSCKPVLHLNEKEALEYTGEKTLAKAGAYLIEKTGNTPIITLGSHGAYYWEQGVSQGYLANGVPVQVKDTVGAGDAHCGTVIACLKQGLSLQTAVERANRAAALVVSGITPTRQNAKLFSTGV